MRRQAKWTPPRHIGPVPHVPFLDRRRHMTDGRFATRYTPADGGGASGFARRSRCCFYVSVSPSAKGARVEGRGAKDEDRGPAESRGQRSEVRGLRSEGAVVSRFQCGSSVRLSGFSPHPSFPPSRFSLCPRLRRLLCTLTSLPELLCPALRGRAGPCPRLRMAFAAGGGPWEPRRSSS